MWSDEVAGVAVRVLQRIEGKAAAVSRPLARLVDQED
jgi:hypothetical protein